MFGIIQFVQGRVVPVVGGGGRGRGELGQYLSCQNLYPNIVYSVANYRPCLSQFKENVIFLIPLYCSHFLFMLLQQHEIWLKLFTANIPIVISLFSQFSYPKNLIFCFRVFVNRSLSLDKIKFFGFDMDYTLAGMTWSVCYML